VAHTQARSCDLLKGEVVSLLPSFEHDLPRCWKLSRVVGAALVGACGWRVEGAPPNVAKAIIIAAPHTSNWDFFYALIVGWKCGLSFHWLVKDSLFQPPFGRLLRWLGGEPVDRRESRGLVEQVGERFRAVPRLLLMVPAEGTRAYRPYWKSGFYWMANQANVPLILGFLDYRRRCAGFGPAFVPTGDIATEMDFVRSFYKDIQGRYPHQASTVRLRIEDGDEG
jgi:1-acyl-sn-glycerol-3-phosphate acyltransferase